MANQMPKNLYMRLVIPYIDIKVRMNITEKASDKRPEIIWH